MIGYGEKLDYHDQPRSIKTKQDQTRSNKGQINENQSLALIALALFESAVSNFRPKALLKAMFAPWGCETLDICQNPASIQSIMSSKICPGP